MIFETESLDKYQKFKNKIDSYIHNVKFEVLEGIENKLMLNISFPYSNNSSHYINIIIAAFIEFYHIQPVVKTETINNRTIIHLFCL